MQEAHNNPGAGIAFIIAAMVAISVNDMLVKQLSGGYPLHEIVLIRSSIGIMFSLIFVQLEGGWSILKTRTPGLHAFRHRDHGGGDFGATLVAAG